MKTSIRLTVAGFMLAEINFSAATLYVSLDSPTPTPQCARPSPSWNTREREPNMFPADLRLKP